jgi:hypothetical protein
MRRFRFLKERLRRFPGLVNDSLGPKVAQVNTTTTMHDQGRGNDQYLVLPARHPIPQLTPANVDGMKTKQN